MLRGGSALASVVLCSACLLLVPTRPAESSKYPLCLKDLISKVTSLRIGLNQTVNCSLYAPSVEDYEKCPSATLTCFADELKVLHNELTNGGAVCPKSPNCSKVTFNLSRNIRRLAESFEKAESGCRQCELHKETSVSVFLLALLTTVENMNSQSCRPRLPSMTGSQLPAG